MLRFVILHHELPAHAARPSHYDLMLEHAGALRTWACDSLPQEDEPTLADQLPDHRLAYLEFQGEVSGGRGTVKRVAAGLYELLDETPDLIHIRLTGDRIAGVLTLACTGGDDRHRWRVGLAPAASSSG